MVLKKMIWPLLLASQIAVVGCTATEKMYVSAKNYTKGEYFLQNAKYGDCIATFKAEVKKYPDDAKAHFYLGRCYMAENQPRDGLSPLEKAAKLNPGHADYHFWLGVAYAANGNPKAERKSYEAALAIDPDHVQSLVYLGHNRFDAKDYGRALAYYNRGLTLSPENPQALFNRGLICREYARTPEEIRAWRIYLEYYPQGAEARQATEFLNKHGVFDYRNYLIGIRTITLGKIQFEPWTADIDQKSREDLDFLGEIFEKQTRFELHIVGYQKNNKALAKEKVKNIKSYLMRRYRGIESNRIRLSWFGTHEQIAVETKRITEDESINIFTLRKKT